MAQCVGNGFFSICGRWSHRPVGPAGRCNVLSIPGVESEQVRGAAQAEYEFKSEATGPTTRDQHRPIRKLSWRPPFGLDSRLGKPGLRDKLSSWLELELECRRAA
jgi:hypothetical protein